MTLAKWLEQRKMTQTAFAKKVGLTQGRISQIIKNGTNDLATAMRIQQAAEYEVTLRDLLMGARGSIRAGKRSDEARRQASDTMKATWARKRASGEPWSVATSKRRRASANRAGAN